MSYNSKYKGSEVEELLDSIGNKVDKVDGKQLSTEDFTTLLKQKLEDLSNYDDTAIQASVSKLRTDLDTLVSGDTTTAIKTFNEVIAFLNGLEDTEDLAGIIASIEQQIAAKQDAITDLATIREGAALGATALQKVPSGYAKTDDIPTKVSELENDVPYTVDSKVPNGVYVVKPDGSLMDYQLIGGRDETCIAVALVTDNQSIWIEKNNSKNTISAALARTEDGVTTSNYTTFYWGSPSINIEGLKDYSRDSDALLDFNGKQNTSFLQKYSSTTRASIKSYCDSFNQTPDENQGFSDWYIPTAGQIHEVYENSAAINTALSIINGSSLPNQSVWSSSENSMPNAYAGRTTVTSYRKDSPYPVVFVRDFSNSSLLERVEELETTKQDTLVSGTNIKTINGESILGEGDIVIEGGSSEGGDYLPLTGGTVEGDLEVIGNFVSDRISTVDGFHDDMTGAKLYFDGSKIRMYSGVESILNTLTIDTTGDGTKFLSDDGTYKEISSGSSSSGAYAEVNHGTSDTTFTLTPNTFHVWDEVATLDLSFGAETSGVANEYLFQFTSGATATTLTLPSDIKWANDTAPTIAENMIYQISVLKGLASVLEFSNGVSLFPVTLVVGTTNQTNMDVYNYLYATYGEVTTTIAEELYFDRGSGEGISVVTIEYGTYEGLTGYWLNEYNMMNIKQVLTSDGVLTQRYPTNPDN